MDDQRKGLLIHPLHIKKDSFTEKNIVVGSKETNFKQFFKRDESQILPQNLLPFISTRESFVNVSLSSGPLESFVVYSSHTGPTKWRKSIYSSFFVENSTGCPKKVSYV